MKIRAKAIVRALAAGLVGLTVFAGPSLAQTASDGLNYDVLTGNLPAVQNYVRNGGDVNAVNSSGDSLLWSAAVTDQLAVVRYLVENGARVNAASKNGSALDAASTNGYLDVVEYLTDRGADVNAVDGEGVSVLMDAAAHVDVIRYLVSRGADVNAKDHFGGTALADAAGDGNLAVVRYLLSTGANPDTRDYKGRKPEDLACVSWPAGGAACPQDAIISALQNSANR